jgi:hypothetical protein
MSETRVLCADFDFNNHGGGGIIDLWHMAATDQIPAD